MLDFRRHLDIRNLHPRHFGAPGHGRRIQCGQQCSVQSIPRRQRLIQFQLADLGPQGGLRQLGNGLLQIENLIGGLAGIVDTQKDQSIDGHRYIVLGDDILRRDVDHLFLRVEPRPYLIHKRNNEIQPTM